MLSWRKTGILLILLSGLSSTPFQAAQLESAWVETAVQQLQTGLQLGGGTVLLVGGSLTALMAAALWTGACFTALSDALCPEPWTQVKAVSTTVLGLVVAWLGWQLLQAGRANSQQL